ncbi:MAG: 23S rRNA (pseudouridine(1915)-N(3))-methyltransferase RlmH [Candidatus Adiutrix sp.]|nr:23S rRNA (pseudouridine(1915)-N(3))-methyltransferase RlmH [Candidatus Adiutrix sp.]
MKWNFLFPGKTRSPFLAEGIADFLQRLQPLAEARQSLVKAAAGADSAAAGLLAKAREGAALRARCRPGDHLIVLDRLGRSLSSTDLAAYVERLRSGGVKAVNLVVGGPWGVDDGLRQEADLVLSLGPLTLPHELARLVILEQIYRAYTILNHLPYHKE